MHKVSESRTVNLIKNMLVQKQTKKQKTMLVVVLLGKTKTKNPSSCYLSKYEYAI